MAAKDRGQIQELSNTYYGADTRACPVERVSELIRIRAYQLFEARGHHPGRELDDWLQAERELKHHLNLR
jgi:Protein of unknown function (DUF2934)